MSVAGSRWVVNETQVTLALTERSLPGQKADSSLQG